jgi:solute carrier family 25 (mitochondrial carnitine/acylcarnitine transporter), member 20/29
MADSAEEIERYEGEGGSWVRTAKDLFAGAAGGVAQVLLGEFESPEWRYFRRVADMP